MGKRKTANELRGTHPSALPKGGLFPPALSRQFALSDFDMVLQFSGFAIWLVAATDLLGAGDAAICSVPGADVSFGPTTCCLTGAGGSAIAVMWFRFCAGGVTGGITDYRAPFKLDWTT